MDKTVGTVRPEYTNCGMCEMQCSIDEPFSQKINNMKICIKCICGNVMLGGRKELCTNCGQRPIMVKRKECKHNICIKCYKELYIGETKETHPNNKNYNTMNWTEMCAHLKSVSDYKDSRNLNYQTCKQCAYSTHRSSSTLRSISPVVVPSNDNPYRWTRSKTKPPSDSSQRLSLWEVSLILSNK